MTSRARASTPTSPSTRARGATDALRKELVAWVRKDIGPIASPDLIQFAPGLPKTRSGKIMRRILRKIAEDEFDASATPRRWPTRRGRRPDPESHMRLKRPPTIRALT